MERPIQERTLLQLVKDSYLNLIKQRERLNTIIKSILSNFKMQILLNWQVTVLLLMNGDQSEKIFYLKLNNHMGARSKRNVDEVILGTNSTMEVTILHEEGFINC